MKADGVNPRTGQPYVRPGGSYKKASAEGTSAASLAKLSQAAEKKVGDATVIATLRGEIATLKEQVRSLTEGRDLAVSAAELKIEKLSADALLKRYQDGIRDGASLARTGLMSSDSPSMQTPR
jgi:hypothetical protein